MFLLIYTICAGLGEFGRVYKGTWKYKDSFESTVSEVVAIKTVKSMY